MSSPQNSCRLHSERLRYLRIASRDPSNQTCFSELLICPVTKQFIDQISPADAAGTSNGIQNINGQSRALPTKLHLWSSLVTLARGGNLEKFDHDWAKAKLEWVLRVARFGAAAQFEAMAKVLRGDI